MKILTFNYYDRFFYNTPHANFIGEENKARTSSSSPVFVSISQTIPSDLVNGSYRALIRTHTKDEIVYIPVDQVKRSSKATLALEKDLLRAFQLTYFPALRFRHISSNISSDPFLSLEESLVTNSFKFGVLYVGSQQSEENEIYANQDVTPRFQQFLEIIGEKVALRGWPHYAAGLDVSKDTTGEYSYYARVEGFEVMFHVASLLPFSASEIQQIERKRHIGNDIVVFVFIDDVAQPFNPSSLTSIFNHVYFVIRVIDKDPVTDLATKYHLSVFHKAGLEEPNVPLFSPPITNAESGLREYLITKAISLERASYAAPGFAPAIRRTRRELLNDVRNSLFQIGAHVLSSQLTPSAMLTPRKTLFGKFFGMSS